MIVLNLLVFISKDYNDLGGKFRGASGRVAGAAQRESVGLYTRVCGLGQKF